MTVLVHNSISGGSAVEIVASIEASIRAGRLAPGAPLPTVRALARQLGVSPSTVAAAYRTLRARALLVTEGRRGTAISPRPPLAAPPPAPLPSGARDLARGNPDPALLPPLRAALAALDAAPVLYGEPLAEPELLRLATRDFERDGIPAAHLCVTGGALDGIERVLLAHLRPGDRVAVEDPGFTATFDLLAALGLSSLPVAVDDCGPLPEALAAACRAGAQALIVTPRAQNPYGAALDEPRARQLRAVLRGHPDLLVIEDDHAGSVAGAPALTLCHARRERWAHVRSVSKTLGPDLRLAVLAGDAVSVSRVEGRQLLGIRWVSHILQKLVAALWKDRQSMRLLRQAERSYARRREALLGALAQRGIEAHGRSGFNVWIPVPEEAAAAQALADAGWAVAAGERFRLQSPPALRVTIATLGVEEAPRLADEIARILAPARRTLSA